MRRKRGDPVSNFKIQSFTTVRISSRNVEETRNWYAAFLGVQPIEEQPGFVSFIIQNVRIDIVKEDEKSPFSKGGAVGYWLVDDIDQAIAHAKSLGGKIYRGPLRVDEIQRTIVQIEDPTGSIIGLEASYK